ncbi:reverse transcriptase domain-containing protein [Tanacetum coccineum]
MEEYIRLEEEKSRRHGKVYNWETSTYGRIWDDNEVHNLRSVETEFPTIVFDDTFTSQATFSCEPTVSPLNDNEIDFRISFDESNDEDYTPTVSYFDDLDYLKDFENEFPVVVYNDALTSKLDFLTKPTITFGRHLEEIHVTWAHLEKKRTRLRTNTKTLEDLCSQSLEKASLTLHDAVTTHLVTASQHFMTASTRTDSHAYLEDSTYDGVTIKTRRPTTMGDENPIRTLGDYSKLSQKGYKNTIELPVGNNAVPLSIRHHPVGAKRMLVPRTLVRGSKPTPQGFPKTTSNWLERLLAGSITTWEGLTTSFLAQLFPPGRTAKLRIDILMFQQHHGEYLSEAWTCFKDLL